MGENDLWARRRPQRLQVCRISPKNFMSKVYAPNHQQANKREEKIIKWSRRKKKKVSLKIKSVNHYVSCCGTNLRRDINSSISSRSFTENIGGRTVDFLLLWPYSRLAPWRWKERQLLRYLVYLKLQSTYRSAATLTPESWIKAEEPVYPVSFAPHAVSDKYIDLK